jgi:hypothetical protein
MVDPQDAARRIRLDNEKEAQALALRREKAQALGRELAQRIISVYPEAEKVWGFGSTFETWRNYRMTSDIDLAVESGDVMAILDLTEDRDFPVDVVDLSSCRPALAKFIRGQGVVLAEEKR